jgi:cell division septation protein DedD
MVRAFLPEDDMTAIHRWRGALLAACVCAVVLACSREQQDWKATQAADTVEAYGEFIAKHPQGELATQARARTAQLIEERDWQRVSSADVLEGYQQFVAQHPNGKWTAEARIRIENFTLSAAAAKGASTAAAAPAAPQAPAAAKPPAPQAGTAQASGHKIGPAQPTSRVAKAGKGGYAIQLGAYHTEAKALASWRVIAQKFPKQLASRKPRTAPAATATGKLYRLQAAAGAEAEAKSLCAALKTHHQPCIVVKI